MRIQAIKKKLSKMIEESQMHSTLMAMAAGVEADEAVALEGIGLDI
jgi:hypothetical protein